MTRQLWIAIIAVEVVALCLCASVGVFFASGFFTNEPVTPTTIVLATPFPPRATQPAGPTAAVLPTNTFVIQTRTRATFTATRPLVTPPSSLYNVLVPTPTAPRTAYPVDFVDTFSVTTYPVSGTTVTAVSKSLDANAIADPHEPNSKYYARTDWYLSANWYPKETTRGCEVERADVSIAITMTLPALATPSIPRDLSDRWSSFIKRAIVHESGHVNLAQDGARSYQRDLGNFAPAPTCDVLMSRLRDLFDKNFASIEHSNVDYDAKTQHGITQGAVFP